MDWFQNKTTQLIALAGIVSTLAGFGYTGATYVNRIENLESKMTRYINEIDALGDQVTALDKNVVAVGEQIKSLNVETQDLSPIKDDIVALQTSVAGISASVDSMYDDVRSLKNMNDNPLATDMGDDQHYPSGRFGGDMSRNEVEMDLSKFMEMLQENSALKDKIRTLEDEKNDNPYQKFIFVAQAIDSWRIIPRAFLGVYMYLLYYTTFWFMDLPEPSFEQSGLISIVVGAGAAWFGLYTNSSKPKV